MNNKTINRNGIWTRTLSKMRAYCSCFIILAHLAHLIRVLFCVWCVKCAKYLAFDIFEKADENALSSLINKLGNNPPKKNKKKLGDHQRCMRDYFRLGFWQKSLNPRYPWVLPNVDGGPVFYEIASTLNDDVFDTIDSLPNWRGKFGQVFAEPILSNFVLCP